MTAPELPRSLTTITRRIGPGWRHTATRATGPLAVTTLSDQVDGNGKRSRVQATEEVDSICLRLCHADGRRAVVLWIRRPGKPWAFDMAWRGREPGETAPVRLGATEITYPRPY